MLEAPEENDNKTHDSRDLSFRSISTILDSIDALVYVADMDTYELIFSNEYARNIWGNTQGRTCWKVLQEGQDGPCSFCTNDHLLDENGKPTGVYVWEFQNTVNNRWYQCRDRAITWVDGRIVRMEIATDITDRKQVEDELIAAKKVAEELAYKDELTRLNNRRAFFEQGNRAFKQAERYGHPISIVMMDLDRFKKVNDTYGHSAGDKVLQELSNLMSNMMREIDIIARMGGEEFAYLLPETGHTEATNLTERIRKEIENANIHFDDEIIKITASFGICTYTSTTKNETLESLLSKADDALYAAKRNGRNQSQSCI
ncbi:MAG: GGDEF domain-containing protein [Gammaproteobacteria bacterium]|nr:GGDEF domain-containing protein [Gammaproteobacteria bacterium]